MSHSKSDSEFFQPEQIEDDGSRILNIDGRSKFLSIESDGAFCLEHPSFHLCLITKESFQTVSQFTKQQTVTSLEATQAQKGKPGFTERILSH